MLLDSKYAGFLANKVRNFKKIDKHTWNFSCPICGDSQKNKSKARGYIYFYKKANGLFYKCWNCTYSRPFKSFLQDQFPVLHDEYVKEQLSDWKPDNKSYNLELNNSNVREKLLEVSNLIDHNKKYLSGLTSIARLSMSHPVYKYVTNRKIPIKYHGKIFLVPKFMTWINSIIPEKFSENSVKYYDTPRLVLPYYDKDGKIFGITGRSFDPKADRKYLEIKFLKDAEMIYGLERVDPHKRVYQVEGPIDSLLIDNAIASGGVRTNSHFEDSVQILDNEPRNEHIVRAYWKLIRKGVQVCIWDNRVHTGEDINDLINRGLSPKEITKIIDECTYQDLSAELKIAEWSRY